MGHGFVRCGAIIASCRKCYNKRLPHDCKKVCSMYESIGQTNAGERGIMVFNRNNKPQYITLRRAQREWDFPVMRLDNTDVQESWTWPLLAELKSYQAK